MENRFAAAGRRYLRTHMDGIYTGMLLTGTLEPHLAEIGESAQAMFDRLVEQMKKAEGVTEQLKAENQMEWVGRMKGRTEINMFNSVGSLVFHEKNNKVHEEYSKSYNLNNFATGNYLIKVVSTNNTYVGKFIIEGN